MTFTSRPMSRTDRGQHATYRRKFNITHHAIERYRERVDEEHRHRDDQDLGNMLDQKLQHPESKQTFRDTKAPDDVTQLFEIVMRTGSNYFVVMRDATAVTVLDPSMVNINFAEGQWKQALNTPFASDKVKKLAHEIQCAPKTAKLTPIDEAVLRGAVPLKIESVERTDEIALPAHGAGPALSPIEQAGLDYARALKRHSEADQALQRAKRAVADAEAAREETNQQREAALSRLNALVERSDGSEP